ncbi:MAG: transcription termination/antitermination protein NusA [Clostridium sp.]|jgi:N utilization substance protein A|nr:transcription termination/antitermination protein NusA [Clostridium sp.]
MSADLIHALEQLEKEKGIDKEILIEAIEAALISAYKRNFGSSQNVRVSIDRESGEFKVYALKKVTDTPKNIHSDISIEEAKKVNADLEEDDVVEVEVTPRKFGRIAAQTAKQVVVQRIREAERGIIFDEFSNKEGEIVTGIVQRTERKNVIIDLGKAEAILAPSEQVPGEEYKFNDRIKTYIIEVKKTTKGPQIMVSRTHPGLIKRLFELEVPEIYEGIVELKSISREPGSRTKIAVYSRDDNVDPVGACVGQKGTRVQAIVDELRGEKIDIINWSSDPKEYISSSLSPAKVIRVDVDEEEKSAKVTVPDFQLSLAIGKEGQNARLAAKLTGWKIDIKSESQLRADIEQKFFNINNSVYDEDFKEDDEEENFEENFEEISEVESKEDVDSEKDTEENFEEDNMDENIV